MVAILAQVTLRTVDNIPENFMTNTLAFDYTNSAANVTATTAALKDFYDALRTTGVLGTGLATGPHVVKYYLAGGPPPNYPQAEDLFNLIGPTSGLAMPSEVALVLSFEGQRIPGQEQARKQGRIYIGPISAAVNAGGRPSNVRSQDLADAGEAFGTAIAATTDGFWGVYSTVNASIEEIVGGWVDNSFDTQRRRGLVRTSRISYTL